MTPCSINEPLIDDVPQQPLNLKMALLHLKPFLEDEIDLELNNGDGYERQQLEDEEDVMGTFRTPLISFRRYIVEEDQFQQEMNELEEKHSVRQPQSLKQTFKQSLFELVKHSGEVDPLKEEMTIVLKEKSDYDDYFAPFMYTAYLKNIAQTTSLLLDHT